MKGMDLHRAGRVCVPPILLGVLAVLIHVLPGMSERLQFVPSEFRGAFTGHFSHWSDAHLIWDLGAFVTLGVLCCRFSRTRFWLAVALSSFVVSLAVTVHQPEISTYRGLSGIDSALFGLALYELWRNGARRVSALAAAGFLLKTMMELTGGGAVFVDTAAADFVNVPLAHLVGFFVGLAVGIGWAIVAAGAVKRVEYADALHFYPFCAGRARSPRWWRGRL